MKEIKTAEEFLTEKGILSNGKTVLGIKFSDGSTVTVNELLHEYASQFEPKWIDTSELHPINMKVPTGWYALLKKDASGYWHQEVKHVKRFLPNHYQFYFKIEFPLLPTNDIEG